jgi:hypothetical protein
MIHAVPRWLLVALLAAVMPAACSRSSPDTDPNPEAGPNPDAMIRVDNRGFSDMTIYIVRGSQRIRLGVANGNSVATFTIRNQYTTNGPLRFLADPIGSSRTPVSDEIVVNPGDMVTLEIPPN